MADSSGHGEAFYTVAERQIEYITAAVGVAGTIAALIFWGRKPAAGVAAGAAISWLNYRWMRLGVATMARITRAQTGGGHVRVSVGTYVRAIGRYALLLAGAYVMLHVLKLPVISLLAGFSAALIGVLVEATRQLFRGSESAASRS